MTIHAIRRPATAAALAVLAAGCATNPATGERELSLIGEGQEIAMGRQANEEVQATIGQAFKGEWPAETGM